MMAAPKSAVSIKRLPHGNYHVYAPKITPEDKAAIRAMAGVAYADAPCAALFIEINPCYDADEVIEEVQEYFLKKGLPKKEAP